MVINNRMKMKMIKGRAIDDGQPDAGMFSAKIGSRLQLTLTIYLYIITITLLPQQIKKDDYRKKYYNIYIAYLTIF